MSDETGRKRPSDDFVPYNPTPRRRRLLLLALGVATATTVLWLMLQPKLRQMEAQARHPALSPAPCAASQSQGCVGGTTAVIVAPPAASQSR